MFLLALVAVGAPVWANAYVCPMDRAAKAAVAAKASETACCTKAQTLPPPAWGVDALETPCDCAQLQWDVTDVDQPRSSHPASLVPTASIPPQASAPFLRLIATESHRATPAPPLAISSTPLWVLNQSIRC